MLAWAQTPVARIVAPVNNASRTTLPGTHPALAQAANDAGRLAGATLLTNMTIALGRSDAQQTALDALVAAQQDPTNPLYHHWLDPDTFAARFGASTADISKVQGWLEQQGFTVTGVNRSRTEVQFSGTAAQVEAAFNTEMHNYRAAGVQHFAPSTDVSVPSALATAVIAVRHLTDLKPHSHVTHVQSQFTSGKFTSSQSGNHFVTPGDVAVIYDINAAYNAGYNGEGQTIAVMGQSAVATSDISNFQTAAGIPVRAPAINLISGTGVSAVSSGDESESDLDLEYTSAIAKGASIAFYYTGNASNSGGAFYALEYAITNKVAPIISISYGDCETDLGATEYAALNSYLQQAAAQGQTVVAAAGDAGSTDCSGDTYLSLAGQEAVAVDWPASSQYVTGMGGSEYVTADVAVGNTTYWTAQGSTDSVVSALSYIPEQVWNDDSSSSGLSSGGGGVSVFTPHPSWQTGTIAGVAIPSSSFRLVPDLSLASSPNNAGYLYCSSDYQSTDITGSCSNGFRDVNGTNLTVAGGTSFAAPIFAGMVAIINQARASTGSGVINPTLYSLAATSAYSTAFHDITTGGNQCLAGTAYCITPATTEYLATTGYDEASGLGSVDFNNLLTAWPGTVAAAPATFTLSVPAVTVSQGNSTTATITITPVRGYTGTVNLSLSANPALLYACFSINNGSVTGTTATTATATIYTYATATVCPAGANPLLQTPGTGVAAARAPARPGSGNKGELPAGIAMAGLLAMGFAGRKSRRLRGVVMVAMLAVVASFGLSGCGSGNTSGAGIAGGTTVVTTGKGAFTVLVTGIDSKTSQTATTSFTVTVQ